MHTNARYFFVRLVIASLAAACAISATPVAQAAHKTVYETQKLTFPDGGSGGAVAISGNLAIVGDAGYQFNSGAAYIYAFDGTSWNFQAKLLPFSAYGIPHFGLAVAISGNMAMVGAPFDDTLQPDGGAVYVFHFDGTAWTVQDILYPSQPAEGALFGYSISISGTSALIGAPLNPGTASVFAFDGEAWRQQATLSPDDGAPGDDFGFCVSLSGNRALVGAPLDDHGTAYVFDFDGTTWNQDAKLIDPTEGRAFGDTVSLSGDKALVGAPNTAGLRGAAYIFSFDGASWSLEAKLQDPGGQAYDYLGSSVALSNRVAIVGARHQLDTGKIYEYSFRQNGWKLNAELVASDANSLLAPALSGKTVWVAGNGGQAYIFSLGGQP